MVWEGEPERLERVVRYMVRPPMAFGVVEETEEGRVRVQTPVDPRTGERGVELDPLEWVHALGRQVPDPRQHLVRYYGMYANRSRGTWRSRWRGAGWGSGSVPRARDEEVPRPGSRQGIWARLLRRILEVDPLLCPRCRVRMQAISVITEPRVVDRILAHVRGACGPGRDGRRERGSSGARRAVRGGKRGASRGTTHDGAPDTEENPPGCGEDAIQSPTRLRRTGGPFSAAC